MKQPTLEESMKNKQNYSREELAEFARQQGNRYFKAKDYETALNYYNSAVSYDPSNYLHYSNRSACLFVMEQYIKCQEDCEYCIRLRPDFEKPYYRLGRILSMKQKYSEALDVLQRGVEKCPTSKELKKEMEKADMKLKEKMQLDFLKRQEYNIVDKMKTLSGQTRIEMEIRHMYHEKQARKIFTESNFNTNFSSKYFDYDHVERKLYQIVKPASLQLDKLPKEELEKIKNTQELLVFSDSKKMLEQIESLLNNDIELKEVEQILGFSLFYFLIASICYKYARMEITEHFCKKSLSYSKENVESLLLLILSDIYQHGISSKSFSYVRKAIKLKPNHPILGALYLECLETLTYPDDVEQIKHVLNELLLLIEHNALNESTAFEIGLKLWFNLSQYTFGSNQQLSEIISHDQISMECRNLTLKIFNSFISTTQPLAKLCLEPFFMKSLSCVMVGRLDLEMLFTRVRASILFVNPGEIAEGMMEFYIALAHQSIQNCFAWYATEKEEERLQELIVKVNESLEKVQFDEKKKWHLNDDLKHYLLLISMFKPLGKCIEKVEILSNIYKNDLTTEFAKLIRSHIWNPLRERDDLKFISSIPSNEVANSSALKSSSIPSPQWKTSFTPAHPILLHKEIEWSIPSFYAKGFDKKGENQEKTTMLVVNCGSGYGIANAIKKYQNIEIIATDKILNNLAYARRQLDECGLLRYKSSEIHLYHVEDFSLVKLSDIKLQQSLDVIYADNLLHSDVQLKESKNLLSLLREGGIIKFNVLTTRYVDCLNMARQYLAKKMLCPDNPLFNDHALPLRDPTADELLQARKIITDCDDYKLKSVKNRFEYFNLNAFEDFIFALKQVKAYQFKEIDAFVSELGLKFVSFISLPKEFVNTYREKNRADPYCRDLKSLQSFSISNMDLLGASQTLTFICEKPIKMQLQNSTPSKKDPLNIQHWLNKLA